MARIARQFRFALIWLVLACAAPQAAPDTSAADRSAIDAGHEAFLAGMRANDCNALMALVAPDAVFVPPNMAPATGQDGVRGWCESTFSEVKTTGVAVSNREVVVAGDWAIEHGTYDWGVEPAGGGAEMRDQGSFVAIWRRQADGAWKVVRDIWNSSLPLPGPAVGR